MSQAKVVAAWVLLVAGLLLILALGGCRKQEEAPPQRVTPGATQANPYGRQSYPYSGPVPAQPATPSPN